MGAERERLWSRWAEIYKNLDAYAALRPTATEVVVLEPRGFPVEREQKIRTSREHPGPLTLPVSAGQRETGGRRGSAMMKATDVVTRAQDVLTVRRVFGEPIERNGLTVIPVVRFVAGGGAGIGEGPDGGDGQARGSGSGGGYGLATPVVAKSVARSEG